MKITYIANITVPSDHTHGIQIMEMCQAFASHSVEVELVVPKRDSHIKEDPFVYYDVKPNFRIKYLPALKKHQQNRLGFLLESSLFFMVAFFYTIFKRQTVYFTRDEIMALLLKLVGLNVLWETHMGNTNLAVKFYIKLGGKVVAISQGLRDLYLTKGIQSQNIIVAPDGADLSRFDVELSKGEAREQLKLPVDKPIVLYKGQLYKWKGVDTLAKAGVLLESKDIICVFIGGTDGEVELYKKEFGQAQNVIFKGRVPRQETPIYQKASDLVVIPNTAEDTMSKLYTSPMKLFGYMASGVPIVAADLPSLREVLDESNAVFFEPDNEESLATTIEKLVNDPEKSAQLARKALVDVEQYSWHNRVLKIMMFIANPTIK